MQTMESRDQDPPIESNAEMVPTNYSLQKFSLYETKMKYYLIGRDKIRSKWRVLKIDRSEPCELHVEEDPSIYTQKDCNEFLHRLAEGNRACGGLKFVTKAYGIVGFIKFLEPYYMIIITKRNLLGNICGHAIYGISETQLITVPHSSVLTSTSISKSENRYKRLFNSIDLSRNFFYSYTYRIMWSMQRNELANNSEKVPYDDMFVWNSFLSRKLRAQVTCDLWTVAVVHGYYKQIDIECERRKFAVTLVARRSRHYAGTRYLKRGVNANGRVANDVETEQLVVEQATGQIASIVQHRGSIPLYWSQDTSMLSLKPDIKLHRNDPSYEATGLHFQNLAARYGNPIVVLNLVKTVEKRPRETILCKEYASAVNRLNRHLPKGDRIKFIQLDFHLFLKRKSHNVLEVLESLASDVLDLVGFYINGKSSTNNSTLGDTSNGDKDLNKDLQPVKRMFQHGILRTNCIDCLDRTNVAQYTFGLAALGRQMQMLGLGSSSQPYWNSNMAIEMMELYEDMGDALALQYGGSTAHNKVFSKWQGKWDATIQSQEFFRSLVRHYNNALLDGEKQDAINIFLGHFRPENHKVALWRFDSDHHRQFRRAGDDPLNDLRLSIKRSFSVEDMLDKDETVKLLAEAASHDFNPSETASLRRQLINLDKRGITISEAELQQCLANEDGFVSFSDVRQNRAVTPLSKLSNSLHRSVDVVKCLGDCADAEWLSSSGNSCEEDAQERFTVTTLGSDNWQGSGILTDMFKKSEERDDPNDNFHDLTALLMETGAFRSNDNLFFKGQSKENVGSNSGNDTGSLDGAATSAADLDSEKLFLEKFANWIQEDHVLCF
ncbi:hypothetical protein KP509_37G024000 [Ceratopteris richardii]|uniref:SAC domain-containing protein n=1 Tax=Ceratopteris richardii TaxID=49495 RepID=A0A8T2Q676_CERRI|nr:hypothetical protein KP509_37G024000 [Ceratopteris richardii]KAH7279548.1 hypothetical protein KP509_37G024000 [Ceratopteris richardii]KAH7279549.1 hypothetical protein KP509_37G024000 [Ceratopteris richardii]KAH7279550.1 hypothetical protein KP509_37G024000 [Ceratopteris richardii]